MPDPNNSGMAGQDMTPAPPRDFDNLQSWDQLQGLVAELIHNVNHNDDWADLRHNEAGEAWYAYADKVTAAVQKIGDANTALQKHYIDLDGQIAGEAGDAAMKLLKQIYEQSEKVRTDAENIPTVVGNIGHDIQSYAQTWWDNVRKTHDNELESAKSFQKQQFGAEDVADFENIKNQAQDAYNNHEIALYQTQRDLLNSWAQRYEDRGAELVPLEVRSPVSEGGGGKGVLGLKKGAPDGRQGWQKHKAGEEAEGGGKGVHALNQGPPDAQEVLRKNQHEEAGKGVHAPVEGGPDGQKEWHKGQAGDGPPASQNMPAGDGDTSVAGLGAAPDSGGTQFGIAKLDPMPAEYRPAATQDGGAQPQELRPADPMKATRFVAPTPSGAPGGQDEASADPGTGAADDPARQQGLADAKNAAGQAIDNLQSAGDGAGGPVDGGVPGAMGAPVGGGGASGGGAPAGGGGTSGGGAAGRPDGTTSLPPASLSSAPADSGTSAANQAAQRQRQQELQRARGAASDAIAGLSSPGSGLSADAPDTGSAGGGAGAPAGGAAGAPGGGAAPGSIPEFQPPASLSSEPGDPGAPAADPAAQQRELGLEHAKDAASQAIDNLMNAGDDPAAGGAGTGGTGSSLNDFLSGRPTDGGGAAPGGDGGPDADVMDKAHQDAKAAIDKSIESLPGYNGNDAYAKALHEAKESADAAIDRLSGHSGETTGGGLDPVKLESAPPMGHGPQHIPGGAPGGGPGIGGGVGGGGDLPAHNALDGAGAPAANGVLDTDMAARSGLTPATTGGAVPQTTGGAVSSVPAGEPMGAGGMPMSPGMGGMGGMGQNGNKERQPNTWLQADGGTWQDENQPDGESSSVLGRTT